MFRTASCIAAIVALAAPAALAETKSYDAQSFEAIKAHGAIDVIYERAATPSITVEQENGDFSDVYIDFDGDTLVLSRQSLRKGNGWLKRVSTSTSNNRKTIKVNGKKVPYFVVRVAGPTLEAAKVSNSAKLTAVDIEAATFAGRVSSSSILSVSGTVASAKLDASSSSELYAGSLAAERLEVDASSSADLEARVTGTQLVNIDASSSSDVVITSLAPAAFSVDASASSDVEITGACSTITVSASASSDVEAGALTCSAADVSASSSSDVAVFASTSVEAHASSGADIVVGGNPSARDVSRSSGGDVEFVS
ncbi:MAG: DUF2807 domain-containing protein [Hyphomonas sp.]|nr:DUF2807 domain-containing protein [Hyphomonas sp.]